MKQLNHTPGPWRVIDHDEDHITITDSDQEFGACRIELSSCENRGMMKANAELIASAPELLHEARRIADEFGYTGAVTKDSVLQLMKAIAKATGGG